MTGETVFKKWYIPEYYLAIKKKEILPFATWINLEIMLSEVSWTEKNKYCMISIICGISETKQNSKQLIQRTN